MPLVFSGTVQCSELNTLTVQLLLMSTGPSEVLWGASNSVRLWGGDGTPVVLPIWAESATLIPLGTPRGTVGTVDALMAHGGDSAGFTMADLTSHILSYL